MKKNAKKIEFLCLVSSKLAHKNKQIFFCAVSGFAKTQF